MNLFCRLFGHTWWPETSVPDLRWNTTDEQLTLVPTMGSQPIRHYELCKRCGVERDLPPRSHDGDTEPGQSPPLRRRG